MNNYNITNIKDLPQLEQILDGNFLVVENVTGTNKLDFGDFVVGPSNTSFYTSIANDILSLSSTNNTQYTEISALSSNHISLSSQVSQNTANINSLALSASMSDSVVVRRGRITILSNTDKVTFQVTVPNKITQLYNSDFNINFLNVMGDGGYLPAPLITPDLFFMYTLSGRTVTSGDNTTHSIFVSSSQIFQENTDLTYTAVIPLNQDQ